jgi:GAF domain-containing protein
MHRVPTRMEGALIEYVIRQGHPIIIPNIHNEKQYRFPELARKSGLMSLLAVPLTSQGKVMGSINIYTRDERAFSDDEVGFVKVVAGQAAIAIQNARLMSETLDMKRTLEARKLIERAKGLLQYEHHLTEEEAYLRLRNESRRLHRSMRDLAEAVILAGDLNRREGPPRAAIREDEEFL